MIHRYWTGPEPLPSSSYVSGKIASELDEVQDWNDYNLPFYIRDLIENNNDPFHKSNIVRIALLAEFGGIWIDHDITLLDMPIGNRQVAHHGRAICPSVMKFPKNDPILWHTLQYDLRNLGRFINTSREWDNVSFIEFDRSWAINYSRKCYDGQLTYPR